MVTVVFNDTTYTAVKRAAGPAVSAAVYRDRPARSRLRDNGTGIWHQMVYGYRRPGDLGEALARAILHSSN